MLRTDLCDEVQFTARHDGRIELSSAASSAGPDRTSSHGSDCNGFPLDGTNLITRAADALQQLTGTSLGISIVVRKQIPMESGLGGGSGNAATTLRALNQLWDLDLPEADLHDIAASLGSDINFLLSGCRAAVCRGRGEQVEGIPLNGQLHGVLAVPRTGNSTRKVFAALQYGDTVREPDALIDAFRIGALHVAENGCFNRLQEPACQINSEIRQLLADLKRITGTGILTGSGSACFSFLPSRRRALAAASELNLRTSNQCWAFRC